MSGWTGSDQHPSSPRRRLTIHVFAVLAEEQSWVPGPSLVMIHWAKQRPVSFSYTNPRKERLFWPTLYH